MISPARQRLSAAISCCMLITCGCFLSSEGGGVSRDEIVEFRSRLGNVMRHPSQWKQTDEGDTMTLESPDGHAKFVIWSCTVAGSGSPSDFLETIVGGLERETGLKRGDAESVDFEMGKATKVSLRGGEDSEESWNVYTLRSGDFYHALMLRATPLAMELNGPFYDEIAITFSGASKSP